MAQYKVEICGVHTGKLPLLTEEEKQILFDKIKTGDRNARDTFIHGNLRLVLSIIQRFTNTGENVDDLIETMFSYLEEGPQFYDEDTITDQPVRQIVAELIREKALRLLQDEIPHGIAVSIDSMKERPGKNLFYDIDATIVCERDSHKGIIIGKQGAMLKRIGTAARKEIEDFLEAKVNLKLWVKVKKDWRDSDFLLKNFGFKEND